MTVPACLVIFDVDGTLIQSTEVDDRCLIAAIEQAWGIKGFDTNWADYENPTAQGITGELFRTYFGKDPEPHEVRLLKNRYEELLVDVAVRNGLIVETPGARDLLIRLQHDSVWRGAIATGGWLSSARLKLDAAGIPVGSMPMATCDDDIHREGVIEASIQKSERLFSCRDWRRIVYVGDGIWDARAAAKLGIGFVGIAGVNHAGCLTMSETPNLIVDFSSHSQFFDALNAATPFVDEGDDSERG